MHYKGETANFDLFKSNNDGIMKLSVEEQKPIGNSIITSFNRIRLLKDLIEEKSSYGSFRSLKNKIMGEVDLKNNARIIVVQKLYGYFLNKDSEIFYPKHRYKKFIKDTVRTLERKNFCWKI